MVESTPRFIYGASVFVLTIHVVLIYLFSQQSMAFASGIYIVYKNLHKIRYIVLKKLKQFLKCVSTMTLFQKTVT